MRGQAPGNKGHGMGFEIYFALCFSINIRYGLGFRLITTHNTTLASSLVEFWLRHWLEPRPEST